MNSAIIDPAASMAAGAAYAPSSGGVGVEPNFFQLRYVPVPECVWQTPLADAVLRPVDDLDASLESDPSFCYLCVSHCDKNNTVAPYIASLIASNYDAVGEPELVALVQRVYNSKARPYTQRNWLLCNIRMHVKNHHLDAGVIIGANLRQVISIRDEISRHIMSTTEPEEEEDGEMMEEEEEEAAGDEGGIRRMLVAASRPPPGRKKEPPVFNKEALKHFSEYTKLTIDLTRAWFGYTSRTGAL